MVREITITVVFGILSSVGFAQTTITERIRLAKEKPGTPVIVGTLGEPTTMNVEELAKQATLVLEATVTRIRTYINATDTAVVTDFAMTPLRVLAGQVPVTASRAPGVASPLIVTVYGGEVVKDGITIRAENHTLEPLKDRSTYLLFLRPSPQEPRQFNVFNAAVFEVMDDTVRPLARGGRQLFGDFIGVPRADLARRIASTRTP